ncbi:TPA: hypothetical protein L4U31_002822 [Pseudomonas aeruginosa]|nr:hypothetical protein [Pseudomonas aeruginosa]
MSTKNIGIALVIFALVVAATLLELGGHRSSGLWFLIVLMALFTGWETKSDQSEDSISVLDAWEALGNDIGLGPSKDELLDSLRFTAALADMNEGGNPAWNAVVRERVRQVQGEGYCVEHDDEHARGELGAAALCYVEEAYAQVVDRERQAMERTFVTYGIVPDLWPWSPESWKPAGNPRRNLEKALALGLAELERLIRAEAQEVRS